MAERWDAIVVGAGVGGLASAITLGAAGRSVLLVDALPRVGGKLGLASFDGVDFDTGPSVLTLPDVIGRALARAGLRLEDELELLRPDPATEYAFDDGLELPVRADVEDTLVEVERALGAAARDELASFLRYAEGIWDLASEHFVLGEMPGLGKMFSIGRANPRLLKQLDPLRTMAKGIYAHIRDPHLRALLLRYATYNGSDPRRAPATLNCIAHVELTLGLHGVCGGMYEVARALERAARAVGVELALGARVTRIDRGRGGVEAVVLDDGARLLTGNVVVNADARHLYEKLLTPRVRFKPLAPSMSGWTGVLRARRRADRAGHAVLMPRVYEHEFDDIFERDQAPREPTVYVCAQEKAHGRAGWAEHEPLFIMANAPAARDLDRSDKDAAWLASACMERLVAAGWIDADDEVIWDRSPRALAETFPDSMGSIYGAASNTMTAAFKRPTNTEKRVPGLFLASGSAHPGGGVPLCVQSGLLAGDACVRGAR
jgi:phytoene desaturase